MVFTIGQSRYMDKYADQVQNELAQLKSELDKVKSERDHLAERLVVEQRRPQPDNPSKSPHYIIARMADGD